MKYILSALIILLGFSSANAYELKFAVERDTQSINADYSQLVEFQPILNESIRSAALYYPGTQDDVGVKAFAELIETRKNGNLSYEIITKNNVLDFNTAEDSDKIIELGKDNCGVSTVVATKDLGVTKLTFTLIDSSTATCRHDNKNTWQVVLMIEDNGMTFIQKLEGNPESL